MVSYCDNCMHKVVCKYTKDVRDFENKTPNYGTCNGPVLAMTVSCIYKNADAGRVRHNETQGV